MRHQEQPAGQLPGEPWLHPAILPLPAKLASPAVARPGATAKLVLVLQEGLPFLTSSPAGDDAEAKRRRCGQQRMALISYLHFLSHSFPGVVLPASGPLLPPQYPCCPHPACSFASLRTPTSLTAHLFHGIPGPGNARAYEGFSCMPMPGLQFQQAGKETGWLCAGIGELGRLRPGWATSGGLQHLRHQGMPQGRYLSSCLNPVGRGHRAADRDAACGSNAGRLRPLQ